MLVRIKNRDHDTYPSVFHHGGGDAVCRNGLLLKQQFFDLIGEPGRHFRFAKSGRMKGVLSYRRPRVAHPLSPIPRLSVVTFTSFRFPGSSELSLNHFGVPVDVIRQKSGQWHNIGKIGLLRDYLETVDSDYVLYLDSHDAFVTSDIRGIVDAFEKLGCRLLYQADANDWPPSDDTRAFFDSIADEDAGPFRYACSGIFMGETAFLKRVVAEALETEPILEHDDQGIYKKVFAKFHPEARVDYRCELFQALTDYHHVVHPERHQPANLNLELQSRLDPAQLAPDLRAKGIRHFVGSLGQVVRQSVESILDRLSS